MRVLLTLSMLACAVASAQLTNDYSVKPVPPLPTLPGAGRTFVDPTFGTTVLQVTDHSTPNPMGDLGFSFGAGWKYEALSLPQNDGTIYLKVNLSTLVGIDPVKLSLTGKTISLPFPPSDTPYAWYFSHTRANLIIVPSGSGPYVYEYNLDTRGWIKTVDATAALASAALKPSGAFQLVRWSYDDDRYLFVSGLDGGGSVIGVYSKSQQRLLWFDTCSRPGDFFKPTGDKTLRYVLLGLGNTSAVYPTSDIVDIQTGQRTTLTNDPPDYIGGHGEGGTGDFLQISGSDDWLVRKLDAPHIVYAIFTRAKYGYSWQAVYLSLNGHDERWALATFICDRNQPNYGGPFSDEIYDFATDGSGAVRRYVHHHSSPSSNYWTGVHATKSPDNSLVVFSSNWGRTDPDGSSSPWADIFAFRTGLGADPIATSPVQVEGYDPGLLAIDGPAVLNPGQTFQFSSNYGSGIQWAAAKGTFSSDTRGLYAAPGNPLGADVITATYGTQTASAVVTFTNLPPVGITVSPSNVSLTNGQSLPLTVTITGTANQGVSWGISPLGTGVMAGNTYIAPAIVSSQQMVTLKATSSADSTVYTIIVINLSAPVRVPNGSEFKYHRAITISHLKALGSDQADFCFLFNTTNSALSTVANGGHVNSASAYDVMFASDAAGTQKLDHEIETYVSATGHLIAWVRVPLLSHVTDTTLYMFYGDTAVSSSLENKSGVWNRNYLSVYHLADNAPDTRVVDSTGHAPAASRANTNTMTVKGPIGNALAFDGSSDYLETMGPQDMSAASMTISAWVRPSSTARGAILAQKFSNSLMFSLYGARNADINFTISGQNSDIAGTTILNAGQWYYLAGVYDGTNVRLFVNGVLNASSSTLRGRVSGKDYISIGHTKDLGEFFAGAIGEVRVSFIARSGDWIQTEYENQSNPASFYGLGPELSDPSLAASIVHSGTFTQGQQNTTYTVIVSNTPNSAMTNGPVTVTETVPSGLTLLSMAGSGWTCPGNNTCMRNDPLPGGVSYPPLMVTVNVASDAPSQVTNTVTVSFGGSAVASVGDVTRIVSAAVLSVSLTHTGNFSQGQSATYTAAILNAATGGPTLGAVTVSDTIPSGLTLVSMVGSGWACTGNSCVRSDSLAGGKSYPSITINVTVASTAPLEVSNQICASGGGSATVVKADPTSILPAAAPRYAYRRSITIGHSKVPNTDLNNFPVLLNTMDPALANTLNGGHVSDPHGYDIIFCANPDGTGKLDHEIQSYDPKLGHLVAWFRAPFLSHTSDTAIYLFYGNSAVSASQENRTGVWSNGYRVVYHLADNASTKVVQDSLGNAPATSQANTNTRAASGQVDGALNFNGSSDNVQSNSHYSLSAPTLTISAWVNLSSTVPNQEIAGQKFASGLSFNPYGGRNAGICFTLDGLNHDITGKTVLSTGRWYYLAGTYDGSVMRLYVNGSLDAGPTVFRGAVGGNDYLGVGGLKETGHLLNGTLEEVRVSFAARSADWLAAEYNNQSSPTTFYTVSSERASTM